MGGGGVLLSTAVSVVMYAASINCPGVMLQWGTGDGKVWSW